MGIYVSAISLQAPDSNKHSPVAAIANRNPQKRRLLHLGLLCVAVVIALSAFWAYRLTLFSVQDQSQSELRKQLSVYGDFVLPLSSGDSRVIRGQTVYLLPEYASTSSMLAIWQIERGLLESALKADVLSDGEYLTNRLKDWVAILVPALTADMVAGEDIRSEYFSHLTEDEFAKLVSAVDDKRPQISLADLYEFANEGIAGLVAQARRKGVHGQQSRLLEFRANYFLTEALLACFEYDGLSQSVTGVDGRFRFDDLGSGQYYLGSVHEFGQFNFRAGAGSYRGTNAAVWIVAVDLEEDTQVVVATQNMRREHRIIPP